jgi:hypothetical protein
MEDDDAQALVSKNLKLALSSSYACNAILVEVVKDIVRSKKGAGRKYLDDLFERASFRLDIFDPDDGSRKIGQTAETRAALSTFFAWAKEALAPRQQRKRRSSPATKKRARPKK